MFVVFLLIITVTMSFAFKIDELKFGKEIEAGKIGSKIFTLTNNNSESIIYKIAIEGKENVKISPKLVNLYPKEEKRFEIKIEAEKIKGEYDYFLVIKEIRKEKLKKDIDINKTVRIKQLYIVK